MVGDSIYDLEAGRQAQVATIGFGIEGGTVVIQRLSDLLDHVKK